MRRAKKVSITVVTLVVVCAVYVIHRNAVQERWREAHDDFVSADHKYQKLSSDYQDCVNFTIGTRMNAEQECYSVKVAMDDAHEDMRVAMGRYSKAAEE